MDVSPEKQNLDSVFGTTRFSIDFYQRDYKWTAVPVIRLLDDIFFKFNETYKKNSKLTAEAQNIEDKYPWYYLNTYVTNRVEGNVFIVDGQQRLTTLSLMTIALLHLAKDKRSNLDRWLDTKIAGAVGREEEFRMDHVGHRETQEAIKDNKIRPELSELGITSKNMIANFSTIKVFFTENLHSKHKLETFIYYFLRRLVLIELSIAQTDVPMVFEVINDRGVRLAPYEILKGKLLGQISKEILHTKKYNESWDNAIDLINESDTNKDKDKDKEEADNFFRNYLKAKFANNRKDGQRFDGDYHREIFKSEFKKYLDLSHNEKGVVKFLDGQFKYFSQLYLKCLKEPDSDFKSGFYYNRTLDIDGASMLVISSCFENDTEEKEKFKCIPLEVDRLYSLLQLQGAYNSSAFQDIIYKISTEIREKPLAEVRKIFDLHLKEELAKRRDAKIEYPFNYRYFKQIGGTLNQRFKRYVLSRVEEFFAEHLNKEMAHPIYDLTWKTGANDGFHIEHILAKNLDNIALFNDEDEFEIERNRLGGLLLLKGKDNESSNNEIFSEKLKTYAGSLLWNETLTDDFYKSNTDLRNLNDNFNLSLQAMTKFGAEEVEERQKILFKIAEQIWK